MRDDPAAGKSTLMTTPIKIRIALCLFTVPIAASLTADAAVIADSVADFSGTQGANNWSYGYYSGTLNPSSLAPLSFDGANWIVDPAQPDSFWTFAGATSEHPNGAVTSGGRTPEEQWVVRRWASEIIGTVNVSGSFSDLSSLPGVGSGVTLHVFAGNTEVYNASIDEGGSQSFNFNVPVTLALNLDFALDPRGNDFTDATAFAAQISPVAAPDTGSSLTLLGFGLVGLRTARSRIGNKGE